MYELGGDEGHVEIDFSKQDNNSEPWWSFRPLTYLDLSSNVIQQIPAQIKMFEDLTVLNVRIIFSFSNRTLVNVVIVFQLQDNALTTLPVEIGMLKKLTKLNASHNKINKLPDELYKLNELQVLQLSHNCIESINKDVGDMIMLQQLVINICSI